MRGSTFAALSVLVASLLLPAAACSQKNTDPPSIEWVCQHEPGRVQQLFASLDYSRPGMDAVRAAADAKDYPRACAALLDYYHRADTAAWLRMRPVAESSQRDPGADAVVQDSLAVYNEKGTLARTHDGGIDWNSRGPKNDPEWGHALNGMYSFDALLHGYTKTGRPEYAARVDTDVRDWVLSNPPPKEMMNEGPWRGMDAASRAHNWMNAFYRLQSCDAFSPAARILMLSSLIDHAHYLQAFHHRDFTNRCIMELNGLATIGCAWPEFRDAPEWRKYALDEMQAQMAAQVYPDGVHTELTSIYHRVVTEQFDGFLGTFRLFGYDAPPALSQGVERMWSYLAMAMRPDGTTPENNDSDRRDVRDKLKAAATTYHRDDWTFIATNGATGTAPATGPSVMFPWAGQLIMRSGWDKDAQWGFFDVGPAGTAHQHRDKLHLSIDAFGRALLVDAGRFSYADDAWHVYFTGSQSHNVILIDGHGQQFGELRATAPVASTEYATNPAFDFARGTFSGGYAGVPGKTTHTRVVVYVKNEFWVVADRIETDQPHTLDALWHFAPDCHVRVDGNDVLSDDADLGNVRIVPVGGPQWTTTLVSGQGEPLIQGWYSPNYGEKTPATAAVFHAKIPGTTTFAWVLVPARGKVPKTDAQVTSNDGKTIAIRVQTSPDHGYTITIPMIEGPPEVKRSARSE